MSRKSFIELNDNAKEVVLKEYNSTIKEFEESIDTLKQWIKKQPHLPQNINEERLHGFLLLNKLNLEKTKTKIEKFYTLKGYLIGNCKNVLKEPKLKESFKSVVCIPLPKQYGYYRIFTGAILSEDSQNFEPEIAQHFAFCTIDVLLERDYSIGSIFISDIRNFNMSHINVFNVSIIKYHKLAQDVFSGRITSIHILCNNAFLDHFLAVIKRLFNPKLFQKISLHKSVESLHEAIPKEYLPKDFGGDLKSLEEYACDWYDTLLEWESYLTEVNSFKIDESLRPIELKSEIFEDIQGTFKKLTID